MEDKDMQMINHEEIKEKTLSFMNETIKEKPIDKRKLAKRTALTAFSALIFGVIACFTLLVLEPVISNWLYPEEISKVRFPEEEEEISPEEMLTEDALQEELQEDLMQQVEEVATENTEKALGVADDC